MKLSFISTAILLSTLPTSLVLAAGLDRSGQSISAFLQSGNYAEAGISVLDPTVKGKDLSGNSVSDMADDYYFANAAIKVQATEQISLGLIYDQPFGADATYQLDGSNFASSTLNEGTQVEVKTQNLTALIGYQPTKNWNIYAGPVWQTVEADIALRGRSYQSLSGYNIKVDQEEAYGWLAGAAYQIPEIALKAAITYRSEIKHKAVAEESINVTPMMEMPLVTRGVNAVTPQSVNIDLQSGISQNTLAFANVRWVHWDQFVVSPAFLKSKNLDLISYSDDQYSATIGLGHKFNHKWSGSSSVGYDSGAGNPVTTLGPTEGYWSVGLGGQYSPTQDTFIQAGVKYFWLGDAVAQTGGQAVGKFENNYAMGYGLKMGYKF